MVMEHVDVDDGQVMFSYHQAARKLGVTETTVRKWASRGKIHVRRIGRRTFIPKAALDRLAERAD
jgi:excisionase family DNA binding protein